MGKPLVTSQDFVTFLRLWFWDQYTFLGNCAPTPPLSQHENLLLTKGKMLA